MVPSVLSLYYFLKGGKKSLVGILSSFTSLLPRPEGVFPYSSLKLPGHGLVRAGDLVRSRHPLLSSTELETGDGAYLLKDDNLSQFASSVEQFLEILNSYVKK